MALKERTDYYLRETEKVRHAAKKANTVVKDYSLEQLVEVYWDKSQLYKQQHLVDIVIGGQVATVFNRDIGDAVQIFVDQEDEYGWFPRDCVEVRHHDVKASPLIIDTRQVNQECLRDHIAAVTIKGRTALIDVDELLKATRYA